MFEEVHSNQLKQTDEGKKKNASWETDVNNGPGNGRSKLLSQVLVCFHTHPGLAIKHARVALQLRGGMGGGLMQGSAESRYVPSWGSRATIPLSGKGVRYSTVYQEKGQSGTKSPKSEENPFRSQCFFLIGPDHFLTFSFNRFCTTWCSPKNPSMNPKNIHRLRAAFRIHCVPPSQRVTSLGF